MSLWVAIAFQPMAALTLSVAAAQPPILEVEWDAGVERGLPIFWSNEETLILKLDGSIRHLKKGVIKKHRTLSETFAPISVPHLRGVLQQELGGDFEVSATSSYLIATPRGSGEAWGKRFLQLHAAFVRFFATRGWALRQAEFPLVAIVYPNQQAFLQQSRQQGVAVDARTLGYYSEMNNRMMLFQQHAVESVWHDTDRTVLHESTHQLAFNLGVHQRLADTPLWAIEGLASLFEAPGFAFASDKAEVGMRVNRARLQTWQEMSLDMKGTLAFLEQMIVDDRVFQRDPDHAYALSWAIALFLAERDSNRYTNYLAKLARLKPNREYSAGERSRDFREVIGADAGMLLTQIDRFLSQVE